MTRRVAYLLAMSLLASSGVLAQAAESTLPLDRFRPTMDTSGFAVTEGGGIPGHLELQAGLVFDYALNPLVVREEPSKRVVEALVQNRIASNLLFTLGLFEYVSLGVDLPVLLFQNASSLDGGGGAGVVRDGLAALGIGDLKLVPKIRVLRQDRHLVNLSLVTAVTLPTAVGLDVSNGFALDYGTSYLGEGPAAFSIIPEVILSADYFGVRGAVNVAYRLRPPIFFETPRGAVTVNPEIAYRAGLGYDVAALPDAMASFGGTQLPDLPSVLVFAEVFGATADRNPFGLLGTSGDEGLGRQELALSNALEWAVGARWALPVADLHVEGGVGSGIIGGFGSPDLRVFTGLRWAPVQKDKDGDGVLDEVDACPDEPEDIDGFEDSDGCPDPDNDGDGLPDSVDRCPLEPEDVDGFEDTDGCPERDNDQDGLDDQDDKCPDDKGPVETRGCPIHDRDQDGLADDVDRCPDQPGPQNRQGCPVVDTDEDGLNDDVDQCPAEPGPTENEGCPLNDRDRDGVLDKDDKCPDERGPPDRAGCPIPDKDGDGVEDKVDACPDAAGPPVLKGCPDSDGDGLADKDDRCPEEPGLAMFKGCADDDKDGVPNPDDKCPTEPETINGVDDDDGCPDQGKSLVVVTREKIEISETVYFQTGSARIQRRSFNLLNQVAQVLKASSQIKRVRVEGHTDSVGRDSTNKRLSQSRAESVRKYLIDEGVEASRLEAVGYGEEQPIAPNATADGRAKNRRVEFVILEQ